MKMDGKILLFKENEGTGVIITSSRDKVAFSIEDWDDFDVMPKMGLAVTFNLNDNTAFDIVSKENEHILKSDNSVKDEDKAEKELEESVPEVSEDVEIDEKKDELPSEETQVVQVVEDVQGTEVAEDSETEVSESKNDEKSDDKESEPEPFSDEPIIEVIEDIAEELEKPRPESITNSLNIATAVSNYFNVIKSNIDRRKNYKKADGRLDYRLIRRFIWTTYNNLTEIDIEIITPKVKIICDDLKEMEHVYDDFVRKTKYPSVAYEEVFLSCQAEYLKIKNSAESLIEKLTTLKSNEKIIGGAREIKKKELEDEIQTEQFNALEGELKSLNGSYVDVVHMMAELDERYKQDMKLLKEFESEYREDFYKIFSQKAKEYEFDLIDILNAQAYIFDIQQWHQAKRSKSVKSYFKDSSITGELNTKTYLRYYLNTQDEGKATDETKKLFELYEYLKSVQKDYIMIVVSDYQDAMDFELAIHDINKSYDVKSFVDELVAIKWAMKNSVKILIVEEMLANFRVEKFLYNYNKNVLSMPKIIFLGNKPKMNVVPISKLLTSGASPKLIATSVESLMSE